MGRKISGGRHAKDPRLSARASCVGAPMYGVDSLVVELGKGWLPKIGQKAKSELMGLALFVKRLMCREPIG